MDAKNILGSNKDLLSSSLRPYYMSILCSFDLDKEIMWKKFSHLLQLVVCKLLKPCGSLRKWMTMMVESILIDQTLHILP